MAVQNDCVIKVHPEGAEKLVFGLLHQVYNFTTGLGNCASAGSSSIILVLIIKLEIQCLFLMLQNVTWNSGS